MRRLGKLCALLTALCLLAQALTGCGAREEGTQEVQELSIYASFYPIWAIAEMITEGVPDLQLHQLAQPQDGCLRAYSLSDWDAALLGSADALLLGGGGLESFAEALAALEGEHLAVVQLESGMERMEVAPENADPEAAPHWEGENPHVYLSPEGAIELAGRVAQNMVLLDPRYEEQYRKNLEAAERALGEVQAEVEAEAAALSGARTAVLNEALAYTARDCDLDALYWARESGEDMDEAELEELLAALRERDIRLVLIERQAPQRLLEALADAGLAVAALDVLSTHRAEEGAQVYLEALRVNAARVREAYQSIPKEGA